MCSPVGQGTGDAPCGVVNPLSKSALAPWFLLWGVSESGLHPLEERQFAPRAGFGKAFYWEEAGDSAYGRRVCGGNLVLYPHPQRHLAPGEEPLATPALLPGTVELEPFNRDKITFLKTTKQLNTDTALCAFFLYLAAPCRDALAPAIQAASYDLTSKPTTTTTNHSHRLCHALACADPAAGATHPSRAQAPGPPHLAPRGS